MTTGLYALAPVRDVTRIGHDVFVATSAEPWLAFDWTGVRGLAGAFVTITYRAPVWDPPARPVLRFLRDGAVLSEAIAPAPLEAAAMWTGRVPAGTTHVHVSPANCPGRFGFRIESIRRRTWPALLVEGYRGAPRPARSALLTKLIGWSPESDHNLAWAIGAQPLESFASWSAGRSRPLERDGLDRPRLNWAGTPPIRVVVRAAAGDAIALERTLDSLRHQDFPHWHALVLGGSATGPDQDTRITYAATASDMLASVLSDGCWFGVVEAGATLRAEALAIVAERRAGEPEARMVYGDEISGDGPVLKPGWSPRLAAALPYLGRAVFAAPALFTPKELDGILQGGAWPVPAAVAPLALHRILVASPAPATTLQPRACPAPPQRPATSTIIVLTRDQPALLTRLAASIRARTAPGSFRLLVVDNGDSGGPAATVLAGLASAADVEVLPRPGPFNFSALCNEAAAASRADVLVFLNDDMEILSEGWLDRLVSHALEPDVGAVGARLTYPDGRLQHVGVLAGMGGSAGHFGAPAPGDDPGWAGRNGVTHEVSAVTGACLAVAREKFEAVGGFDAVHLPIELSDIDLCFKLNARGWQTLIDPAVHLMHEESFSRGGATFRRLDKYGDQRAVFVERWRHVLRDDPVFHPALSLYSWRAALG